MVSTVPEQLGDLDIDLSSDLEGALRDADAVGTRDALEAIPRGAGAARLSESLCAVHRRPTHARPGERLQLRGHRSGLIARLVALALARQVRVLAIGCHADDIEIGCGGTLLLAAQPTDAPAAWIVLAASGSRAEEARKSASAFLGDAQADMRVLEFRESFLPPSAVT